MAPSSKLWAVIAGVGPGTGAAVARRFAQQYPVALLARSEASYKPLVDEINGSGGRAIGISTDISNEASVSDAFRQIEAELGSDGAAAAIFNASGRFVRKSILDLAVDDFCEGLNVSVRGSFLFTRAAVPHLLKAVPTSEHPPTIIYTGATASVKSNALMSAFSTGKYGLRALAQSAAREFAPEGVHVAHAIIDGVIDIERTKEWLKDQPAEAKISPVGIADTYWNLHTQPKTAFTNEVDIRPMLEKW